jgi:hypothetical protein
LRKIFFFQEKTFLRKCFDIQTLKDKMDKLNHIQQTIQEITDGNMKFPNMLYAFRATYGITRRSVSEHTGIHHARLVRIEEGRFIEPLHAEELDLLSRYYHADLNKVTFKHDEFISKLKPKRKLKRLTQLVRTA